MLLPNVAIAEVSNYRVPDEQPDTPDWLLGTIDWRCQIIPVVSLELFCGDRIPANPVYSRFIIVNSVRKDSPVLHYALVAAALPRSILFDNTIVDDVETCDLPALQCRVFIGREQAVVPDLDHLQGALEQHWPVAARAGSLAFARVYVATSCSCPCSQYALRRGAYCS
jgi:chemosensory pili system protein ChpC